MNMHSIAALALVVSCGISGVAEAQDVKTSSAGCISYEQVNDVIGHAIENDGDARLMTFSGADAAVLIAVINDEPPRTDLRAERILVLNRPARDQVQIGLIVDGCFRGPTAISETDWQRLKDAVAISIASRPEASVEQMGER